MAERRIVKRQKNRILFQRCGVKNSPLSLIKTKEQLVLFLVYVSPLLFSQLAFFEASTDQLHNALTVFG